MASRIATRDLERDYLLVWQFLRQEHLLSPALAEPTRRRNTRILSKIASSLLDNLCVVAGTLFPFSQSDRKAKSDCVLSFSSVTTAYYLLGTRICSIRDTISEIQSAIVSYFSTKLY